MSCSCAVAHSVLILGMYESTTLSLFYILWLDPASHSHASLSLKEKNKICLMSDTILLRGMPPL